MKILLIILLFPVVALAQPGTEIYVFDLSSEGDLVLSTATNISQQNPGYDNQPYFVDDHNIYFSSNRKGQTDVALYDLRTNTKTWLTDTPIGGEYSPTPMQNTKEFSAIRLDTSGLQRLYRYTWDKEDPEVIVDEVVIGYHVWLDDENLAAFVLGDPLTLQICSIKTDECIVLDENIGRSLHLIPGEKNMFSYISKKANDWKVMSYDVSKKKSDPIIKTLKKSEDIVWLPSGVILTGQGNKLFKFNPKKDEEWQEFADLTSLNLNDITRLAVSPDGSKLAIVVSE